MKRILLSAVLAAWAGAAVGQPWIPVECKTRHEALWADSARKMREAEPGSPIYAPKPFPRNQADVIADFRYGYQQMFKGMSLAKIPIQELPLYTGLQENRLSFRVVRIENWAPDRCRPDSQRDFYFLIYVTDSSSGKDVARAIVNQNGLLAGWAFPWSEEELETPGRRVMVAPRLEDAVAQVQARFGIKGGRAQYVTTWGMPQCDLYVPCVALQAGPKFYLFRDGDLVEFTPQSRGYTRAEMEATRTRRFEISGAVDADKEWLVSVADDRWVLAARVKPVK